MSLIWIDGFDLYSGTVGLDKRYTLVNSPSLGTGRFGSGQCAVMNNALMRIGITGIDTMCFGFALKLTGITGLNSTGSDILKLDNGSSGTQARFGVDNAGKVLFGRNDYNVGSGRLCASSSGVVAEGVWNYFEIEFTRNSSTGSVNIYMNGTLIANASSVNTGSASIDQPNWPNQNDGSTRSIDDLYITNVATKLGEQRVVVLAPTADSAVQFTRSTGAVNYANVDDATFNGDTDYNSSATVGQKDRFDLADLPYTPVSIKAVQSVLCARKDDATTRAIRANIKSGATTSNGSTVGMAASHALSFNIWETDPNTSAAWTSTAVNALQLEYEVVT